MKGGERYNQNSKHAEINLMCNKTKGRKTEETEEN